ncbi:chromate transporter [Bacillus sp. JJ1532]|uniref:chromate transporter n=1 Tax=Bacillus sp. JJ1532 TaxID=3122958 RepID=UPI002FFE4FCB
MIYWQIFLAFFIPGILGYGGGPASIPLVEHEVVDKYGWLTVNEFGEVLAIGNALPGPIATKMAGYIGYMEGGILGSIVGVFATVAPSLILMIVLLQILYKHKESPKVQALTNLIKPTISVLLGVMTYQFFRNSFLDAGWIHTLLLIAVSFILLEKLKISPAFIIVGALCYGAIFLSY